jgi:hypothetical protein
MTNHAEYFRFPESSVEIEGKMTIRAIFRFLLGSRLSLSGIAAFEDRVSSDFFRGSRLSLRMLLPSTF